MNTEQPKQPESVYLTEHAGNAATAREVRHTPGPWVCGWGDGLTGPTTPTLEPFCGGRNWKFTPVSMGMETVAVCPSQDWAGGNHEANARLIAAAPDLLGVAQMVLDEATDSTPPALIAAAEAAIAKATGSQP